MIDEIRELEIDELENVAGGGKTITWGTIIQQGNNQQGQNQQGHH